ncbi:MAG: hypothetical protein WDA16_03120 [Candidatus Thermoplasmatota archaeon]
MNLTRPTTLLCVFLFLGTIIGPAGAIGEPVIIASGGGEGSGWAALRITTTGTVFRTAISLENIPHQTFVIGYSLYTTSFQLRASGAGAFSPWDTQMQVSSAGGPVPEIDLAVYEPGNVTVMLTLQWDSSLVGTYYLLLWGGADSERWAYTVTAVSGVTVDAVNTGDSGFLWTGEDFEGDLNARATVYRPTPIGPVTVNGVPVGANAMVNTTKTMTIPNLFVGWTEKWTGDVDAVDFWVERDDGAIAHCGCYAAELVGPNAWSKGTYTFHADGATVGISQPDIFVGGVIDPVFP